MSSLSCVIYIRVIYLKQLNSGLLLITGPYRLNGVPIRRVHLKSIISTQTKINKIPQIPENITDRYLSQPGGINDERKLLQKTIGIGYYYSITYTIVILIRAA